jgi:hypothetical protein
VQTSEPIPCPACEGEGYIDLGDDAAQCQTCSGGGQVYIQQLPPIDITLTESDRNLILDGLQLLHAGSWGKPRFSRRLGRVTSILEISALADKLRRAHWQKEDEQVDVDAPIPFEIVEEALVASK